MRSTMWSFLSDYIVRSTGFPQHLMDTLLFSETINKIQHTTRLREKLEKERQWFLTTFDEWVTAAHNIYPQGDPVFKKLYKVKKRMLKNAPLLTFEWPQHLPPGDTWLKEYERQRAELVMEEENTLNILQEEKNSKTIQLRSLLSQPDIQEAIAHSNPEVWNSLHRYLQKDTNTMKPSRRRYEERAYISYLQRFLFKNDTTSFFGPLNYGLFKDQKENLCFTRTGQIPTQRRTFLAYWVVQSLSHQINREELWNDYFPLSLHDSFYLDDTGIMHPQSGKKIGIKPEIISILQQCNGQKSAHELLGNCSASVVKQMELLIHKGVVIRGYRLTPSTHHLLEDLILFVEKLPESPLRETWLLHLGQFQRWQSEYSNGNAENKVRIVQEAGALFKKLTGLDPYHSSGENYADRSLYCEECAGDVTSFTLSHRAKDDLQHRLSPLLDWGWTLANKKKKLAQSQAKHLFKQLINDSGSPHVPFLVFLLALQQQKFQLELQGESPSEHLQKWITEENLQQSKVIELKDEWVEHVIELPEAEQYVCVTSPDIMIQAESIDEINQGNFQWIIGEVHWGTQGMSNLLYYHPNRDKWIKEATQAIESLPNGKQIVNVVLKQRAGKNFFLEIFERSITLMGHSGKDKDNVLSFSQLYVLEENEELVIRDIHHERIIPHMGEPDDLVSLVFSEPNVVVPKFKLPAHTPRILFRDIVLQRETWTMSTEEWHTVLAADEDKRFIEAWILKEKYQLPDEVFVRLKGELKPFYIHFKNYYLVDLLLKHLVPEESVTFSELLPNRTSNWFQNEKGSYCCELRGIMVRPPIKQNSLKEEPQHAVIQS
ncbi:hypothetical protein QF041_000778 [Paenibacillus sp. W2I17]|nr:hypothetical protein [Paenibacillus sp. W2I17]